MIKKEKGLIICISGMAGSGKSTLAKRIAERYGLSYFSGGDALKQLAVKRGYKPKDYGWWESEEGFKFLKERKKDERFDKRIDDKLLEMADRGNVVLDSWTMPWLLKVEALKIWLKVSLEKRAERAAKRDQIETQSIMRIIQDKDEITRSIYETLYGFDFGRDLSPFDLILNTDRFDPKEVYDIVSKVIDLYIKKLHKGG
ncbi:MAG: cytidylate kinase family protein [Candidatus Methylarchaceae archaeon HK01M]|nr:cytidylate kinase family protein [Candidatus Methylarchaceae archaeon HK01M]